MLADFILLSDDIFAEDFKEKKELKAVQVEMTVCNGKIVWVDTPCLEVQ